MPTDFVPLLPRKSGSATGTAPAFTPMRPHGPASCAAPVPSPASTTGSSGAPAREPVVTLQKDGDRVTGIRIECACGQVIELACTY